MKSLADERINYFIGEFKSYRYFKHEIAHIDDKLHEVSVELNSPQIQSIATDKVQIENKTYHNHVLELLSREEELINKKNNLIERIALLDKILDKLPEDVSRIIREIYINNSNQESVAMKYNYSRVGLIYHVKSSIKKALNNNSNI